MPIVQGTVLSHGLSVFSRPITEAFYERAGVHRFGYDPVASDPNEDGSRNAIRRKDEGGSFYVLTPNGWDDASERRRQVQDLAVTTIWERADRNPTKLGARIRELEETASRSAHGFDGNVIDVMGRAASRVTISDVVTDTSVGLALAGGFIFCLMPSALLYVTSLSHSIGIGHPIGLVGGIFLAVACTDATLRFLCAVPGAMFDPKKPRDESVQMAREDLPLWRRALQIHEAVMATPAGHQEG